MIETFTVENVKCEGCANTLKKALLKEFGEVTVNLEKEPREITLFITKEQKEPLQLALRKLGYPLTSDTLSSFQTMGTTAKSFLSCAIGKIDQKREEK
jgi:copper chaperone CopZ